MPDRKRILFLNANLPQSDKFETKTYADLNTNIGNSYIAHSLVNMFGAESENLFLCNNIWLPLTDPRSVIKASEAADVIMLCLQDQLRTSFPDEHYLIATQLLRSLEPSKRMVAFSLSANGFDGYRPGLVDELTPARRQFFAYLAERCVSIGVRGPYTAEVLSKLGILNVGIVGCPSYFVKGPDRQVSTPSNRIGKANIGTTGTYYTDVLPSIHYMQGDAEWPIITLMYADDGIWHSKANAAGFKGSSQEIQLLNAAFHQQACFFVQPQEWESHIRNNCILVCGSRLHGAIAALNSGVPAIVTNPDDRARESCEFFGIPHRPDLMTRKFDLDSLIAAADPTTLNATYSSRWEAFQRWAKECDLPIATQETENFERKLQPVSYEKQVSRVVETLTSLIRVHLPASDFVKVNLLSDPSFASELVHWEHFANEEIPNSWHIGRLDGMRCVTTSIAYGPNSYSGLLSSIFAVTPGSIAHLSLELKIEGAAEGNIYADLAWLDGKGSLIGLSEAIAADSRYFKLKQRTFEVPTGAEMARVRVYASGLSWRDNVGSVAFRNPSISVEA